MLLLCFVSEAEAKRNLPWVQGPRLRAWLQESARRCKLLFLLIENVPRDKMLFGLEKLELQDESREKTSGKDKPSGLFQQQRSKGLLWVLMKPSKPTEPAL